MLFASMAFVACSHDISFDENYATKEKELAYEQAFIQKYGKIDPNQSWDFKNFAASARTRAEVGEESAKIEQFPSNNSSFNWLWKYSNGETGELPIADLLRLWSVKADIKAAIDGAPSIKWDPSKYDNVLFRTFAVCNDDGKDKNTKTYHNFGFSDGTHNYWLVHSSSQYAYWYDGYMKTNAYGMDHTRGIDFTNLPDNIRWFAISQKAANETAFYASEYKIEYFKEVTITVSVTYKVGRNNYETKNYTETFWAFNTGAVGSYENIILWVKPTYKTPEETPDVPSDVIKSKRYMCEDLGGVAGSDIDFNDIVFDLVDTNGNQKCYVRALGGTLDIAIKVNGNIVFRKSTYQNPTFTKSQMYNTGWNGSIGVYSDINFDETLAEVDVTGWDPDANNVSVVVYNPTEKPAETIIEFPVVGSVPKMVAVDLQRNWKEEKAEVPDFGWFSDFERQ